MLVVGWKLGRLGNRLFTFAHFIANAIEYNYQVFNPAFHQYVHYFRGTEEQSLCYYPPKPYNGSDFWKRLQRNVGHILFYRIAKLMLLRKLPIYKSPFHKVILTRPPSTYDWKSSGFLEFIHNKLVVIGGWVFWDNNNFVKHADKIREYFRLVPRHEERVASLIAGCRQQCDVLIGVHIRWGDYRAWHQGKYYYTLEQNRAFMEQMANLLPGRKVGFLVCSDEDIDRTAFNGLSVMYGTHELIEDIYAFAGCDYIMGPPSTFTSWASFYGKAPLLFLTRKDQKIALSEFNIVERFEYPY